MPLPVLCFSAEADFAAAVLVGAVGVATLRLVRHRRELALGLLPLLLGLHQGVEGVLWLGFDGTVSAAAAAAARDVWVVVAYVVLPLLVPAAIVLAEPLRSHRPRLVPFVAVGAGVAAVALAHVLRGPVEATAGTRWIAYETGAEGDLFSVAYVTATCGPALLCSRRHLRWFGAANVLGAGIAATFYQVEYASVWCVYAAFASLLILEHLRRERAADGADGGPWRRPSAARA